jgi:UDP-N-acetylmuramyl pentapeptide phosphotransferase/UDP-N-acetylglucosamine-1-phosphate transferase
LHVALFAQFEKGAMNELFSMTNIALVAAGISCIVSLLLVCSQRWHGKHTLDHDLSGVQKFHATAVPRVGGIAVVAGLMAALGFCTVAYPDALPNHDISDAMKLLLASFPAFFVGLVEDLTKRVSIRVRLMATIVSALLASFLLGATIDEFDILGIDALMVIAPFAIVATAFVVAGGSNAINIIDGFNGLASIVVLVMSASLGFIAWLAGDMFVTSLAMLGFGATLGFLLMNYPTGKLFLGDGGAYFLGFWVAEVAVLLLVRNPSVSAWQVLSICAYPVIEVSYSIYRRKFLRKSNPGAADGLHLHTLVYRRAVPKFMPGACSRPWLRNALVACLIGPCIAALALLSVLGGASIGGAMAIVIAQVVLYLVVYKRLVRGFWGSPRNSAEDPVAQLVEKAKLS